MDPLRARYGSKEMKSIFEDEQRIKYMAIVEAKLAETLAEFSIIPKEASKAIEEASKAIEYKRVKEIEKEIKHETMALVKALTEMSGEYGKYVHLGATSNDIIDTAMALQIRDALKIIERRLKELISKLCSLAKRYSELVCVGRTHGVHAEPYSFGLKLALFADELMRHLERLKEVKRRVLVGKYSGALGHHGFWGERGIEIEKALMKKLGLGRALATQVIPRDRLAELYLWASLLASTLDKIATEVRNLQRTEILEVEEPFDISKQVGSSAMPHKRNPIRMERVSGIARMIRSLSLGALENIILRHERDLSNSSFERSSLPILFVLLEQQLIDSNRVFSNLIVHPANMHKNLMLTRGLIMSEAAVKMLVERGYGRQEAHEIVRKAAMNTWERGYDFFEELSKIAKIPIEEIKKALEPKNRLGASRVLIEEVVKRCHEELS